MTRQNSPRFPELDATRGFAVVLMVIFHTLFDVERYYRDLGLGEGFFDPFSDLIGFLFLTVAGVSLHLHPRGYARRGVKLLALGVGISLVTRLAPLGGYVLFGILHCIGAGMFLGRPFVGRPALAAALGAAMLVVGRAVKLVKFDSEWILWLGFRPSFDVVYLDHWPILPWAGWALVGVGLGGWIYRGGQRPAMLSPYSGNDVASRALQFLGRHSLVIYLAHQPLIFGTVMVLKQVFP